MSLNINSFDASDTSIRKAKFILPNERIYTLDFDHNIQMQELKLMIRKAAHIKNRLFRIFSSGEEYTQYNQEIFSSLFPHQKLVVFTLELSDDIDNELILQMNSPCETHSEKFLLYYCFTCNKSICSECFTLGEHKNHIIRDKCFYLLPSKYLVEKLFENWSQKPYEDINISVDLSELKNKLNNVMFEELFLMLKKIQQKCNNLIDQYNNINITSLDNIRNSVRDIKLNCIKALDVLKDDLNIKNIVNNDNIFIQFDKEYKNMGKIENDKFLKNLQNFGDLNKKVSILVENLINQIYSLIYKTLNDMLEDSQYDNIKKQIQLKFIKPTEQNEIINRLSEHKKKRNSLANTNNINSNNFAKMIATSVQNRLNSAQDKEKNKIFNNKEIKPINPFLSNTQEINNSNNSNNNKINNKTQININILKNESGNPFSSAQINRTNISANLVPKINVSNQSLLFSASSNNKDNKTYFNQINNQQNNYSLLNNNNINNNDESNMNINMDNTSQITNINIMNQTQPPIYKTIETKAINTINNNQNVNNLNNNNGDNNNINTHTHIHQHTIITYPNQINKNNSDINNSEIIKYIQSTQRLLDNNNNIKENELNTPLDVNNYINSKYILAPIPQTNSIKVITSNISEERTIPLKFPENFGSNIFFIDCAHCNCDYNNCLYITGGIEYNSEKSKSNALLCIDITKEDDMKIKKLSNMNIARCSHTMISEGKYLYVVGGENMNSVERYDIEKDIWEILPSMRVKRMYPILHINNGYLYAFFGKFNNGDYPCSIERLNLNNDNGNIKRDWEIIIFSNPNNLDVRIYGSAVLQIDSLLYFFGGKVNEITTSQIIFYNFESKVIEKEDSEVMWKEYFRENRLYSIGEKVVQCSENKYFGVYITIQEED